MGKYITPKEAYAEILRILGAKPDRKMPPMSSIIDRMAGLQMPKPKGPMLPGPQSTVAGQVAPQRKF